jgi:translation initiation factor 3 subunit I
VYNTPAPINHAAISPLFDHVMTGGGQDARDVTTTSARQGKFMVRFFHTIYQEEFGRVKGHFGPVNTGPSRVSQRVAAYRLASYC